MERARERLVLRGCLTVGLFDIGKLPHSLRRIDPFHGQLANLGLLGNKLPGVDGQFLAGALQLGDSAVLMDLSGHGVDC